LSLSAIGYIFIKLQTDFKKGVFMEIYKRELPDEAKAKLAELTGYLEKERKGAVGYPCNHLFDYSELSHFLDYSINNLGDPFESSNYRLHTREMELEVIDFFAELAKLPKEERWGYVTTGGTEGNLYGVFLAREMFPDAMVYYSQDTHYSVGKALRILNVKSIMIRHLENGEMDYEDLRESIKLHRDVPAIVFTTVGTTMTGAVDNIKVIKSILNEQLIDRHYIHADAALSGMILPFVDDPPPWSFADGIDSISISGHKMIGAPIPCGVVLAKKQNMQRIARLVEYVGALDTTIPGSRNAFSPLMLWYAIKRHGKEGLKEMVAQCLEKADYAVKKFQEANINAWRNSNSVTVIFPKPSEYVLGKWQIAVHGKIAHIITMPHVTREQIDEIVKDILEHPAQ
jgi:histidine decarboxylase